MWWKLLRYFLLGLILFWAINAFRIYRYSSTYSEQRSDVAIILGAGTDSGNVSAVFRERLNHGIYLLDQHIVDAVILTGGYGEGQERADSDVARDYLIAEGVLAEQIFIETKSEITIENLKEARLIMDSLGHESALLVSDPLHMMRSMAYAKKQGISCESSPTRTSMYRSFNTKTRSLFYEALWYSAGALIGKN